MDRAFWSALIQTGRGAYGALSALSAAFAAAKDAFGFGPVPSWVWWLAAVTLLYAKAAGLQRMLDDKEPPAIKRLKHKPTVMFREICSVISEFDQSYSYDEILHRLMKATWSGEFESYSGHSRLRLITYGQQGEPFPESEIYSRNKLFEAGLVASDGTAFKQFAGAIPNADLFRKLARIPNVKFGSRYLDAYIRQLAMDSGDFALWYRRLKAGRYEL
jgi:hypothetical protein